MTERRFSGVKLRCGDVAAAEAFFAGVFGFRTTHRYGGAPGDGFEEIVMTIPGTDGPMLKFMRVEAEPRPATGATVQIVQADADAALAAAIAAGATLRMAATDYPAAGVRMAVAATAEGLEIELVQPLVGAD